MAAVAAALLVTVTAQGEDFAGYDLRVAIDDGTDNTMLFVAVADYPEPQRRQAICIDSLRRNIATLMQFRKPVISKEINATN